MNQNWNESIHSQWLSGNRAGAMQGIVAALNKTSGKKPFGLAMQFVHYLTLLQEWPVALAALDDLAKTYPGDVVVQRNIALVALHLEDYDRADTAIGSCLNDAPEDLIALSILNILRYRQGRYAEAAQAWIRSSSRQGPDISPAPAWLGPARADTIGLAGQHAGAPQRDLLLAIRGCP